jgi:hypothetical protein
VLLDLLALPAASPDRRAIEERVWELLDRGRPSAALRMLADKLGFAPDKLGFAPAEPVIETAAS